MRCQWQVRSSYRERCLPMGILDRRWGRSSKFKSFFNYPSSYDKFLKRYSCLQRKPWRIRLHTELNNCPLSIGKNIGRFHMVEIAKCYPPIKEVPTVQVLSKLTPSVFAPSNSAQSRLAPDKSAPDSFAPRRSASSKLASLRLAPCKSA